MKCGHFACFVLSVEIDGEIPLTGIGENDNNVLSLIFGTECKGFRSPKGCAGGDAYQQSFCLSSLTAGLIGIVIGDGDDLVNEALIQNIRDEIGADTLNAMRTSVPTP